MEKFCQGVDRKGAIMSESTSDAPQTPTTADQWEQTALQLESSVPGAEIEATPVDNPFHAIHEALITARHARDMLTQREVLARVYAHLAEQAVARGRAPVPKVQGSTRSPRAEP